MKVELTLMMHGGKRLRKGEEATRADRFFDGLRMVLSPAEAGWHLRVAAFPSLATGATVFRPLARAAMRRRTLNLRSCGWG